MIVPLLVSLLLASPGVRAGCEDVDAVVLQSHASWATMALRRGQQSRVAEVYQLLRRDLDCLAGSGLKIRDTDLFLALAAGALAQGDEPAAIAALRAVLAIRSDYVLPEHQVAADHPLRETMQLARAKGRDVVEFKRIFLGKEPAVAAALPPAVPAAAPSVTALEQAAQRELMLQQVEAAVELDRVWRKAGTTTATVGGVVTGLSLAFIAARSTSGASKDTVEQRAHRELWGKVWTGTAIGGGVTMGAGLYMIHVSQMAAGGVPALGLGGRF